MEAMIIGGDLERRQIVSDSVPPVAEASAAVPSLSAIVFATSAPSGNIVPIAPLSTDPGTIHPSMTASATPSAITVTSTNTPSATPSEAASQSASSSSLPTTTLIAILVPICVLLAAIPTIAYLCYLRRRDRRNREMEAEILRGRVHPSGASAHTGDALLLRRSMSASSHREPKYPSVSSEDLDLAAMEKRPRQPEIRDSASIFAPPQHGLGRRGAPGSVDTTRKPGIPVAPLAKSSPTLPPLDFGKDMGEKDSFSMNTLTSKPSVPATLPSFAPTQSKRTPNPALAPAPGNTRSNTSSPIPNPGMSPAIASSKASPHISNMDNPNWPLPASSVRDSATSTYSSASSMPAHAVNKPLPSGLSREISPGSAPVPRDPSTRTQQPGPRESSIAYGMPPMPPSPGKNESAGGDRRSGASRKRDSDAISELSYSMSVRGKRDTRRDTDAISVISAMSDKDR